MNLFISHYSMSADKMEIKQEIKKYDQVKDSLETSSTLGVLTQRNDNEFKKFFENYLKKNEINIMDPKSAETIRLDDGSFVIAKKHADGKMTEIMKIKGGNDAETESLTTEFLKYTINHELSIYYKDAMVSITKNKEVSEIKISYESNLIELKKEIVPTVKEVGEKLKALNVMRNNIHTLLGGFLGKGYVNKQMRINKEIIQSIVDGHYKDVKYINDDLYKKTGYNAIKGKEKGKGTEGRPAYDEVLIKQNNDLMYIYRQYDKIIKLVGDPRYMRGEYSITDSDIIDFGLFGVEELHGFSDLLKINLGIDKARAEEAMNVAMKQLEDQDFKLLVNHLKGVSEGKIDPTKELFKPNNVDKVQKLVNDYPFLKKYVILDQTLINKKESEKGKGNKWSTGSIEGGKEKKSEGQEVDKNEQAKAAAAYTGWQGALAQGGVAGLAGYGLDKTNMTEKQKRTWEGVGNLALTAGMVFVGWKMVSSAWKLLRGTDKADKAKQTKNRAWLLGPAAIIFGTNALSGESPLTLIKGGKTTEWLAGFIGGKKSGKETPTELKYGEGLTGVTAMFSGLEYGKVSAFLEEDSNKKMKVKEDGYKDMIKFYENSTPKNTVAAEFLKSIGEKDKKNLVHLGLTAMGIKNLKTLSDSPAAKFSETASDTIVKLQSVSDRMRTGNYDTINPDHMDLVENYIADKDAKIDVLDKLEARGDVFEKDEDLQDKTGMAAKIKEIAKSDTKKETEVLKAINRFYTYMPTADKKVEISGTWPTIEFKTYENSTKVNLESKGIEGLAAFTSDLELFKAANLTNLIKKAAKGKQAQSENPFNVSFAGRDIEFDDAKLFSLQHDTTMVSGGWGGVLDKISPILEANKQAYCDYLNKNVDYIKAKVA